MDGRKDKAFPVSWDQFHRDARALAWRLSGQGAWQAVVTITRGGLVPAAVVARELGIRVIETVCVASYDYDKQGPLSVLKAISPEIVKLGKDVLVVDDLVDTGRTAKLVRRDDPARPFRRDLRQADGAADGRHVHNRGEPGHLDLLPVGHGPRLPAADQPVRAGGVKARPFLGRGEAVLVWFANQPGGTAMRLNLVLGVAICGLSAPAFAAVPVPPADREPARRGPRDLPADRPAGGKQRRLRRREGGRGRGGCGRL